MSETQNPAPKITRTAPGLYETEDKAYRIDRITIPACDTDGMGAITTWTWSTADGMESGDCHDRLVEAKSALIYEISTR